MTTMRMRTHINVTLQVYCVSDFSLPVSSVLSVGPVAGSTFQLNIWALCGTITALCGANIWIQQN
jgi:hypothetical protein